MKHSIVVNNPDAVADISLKDWNSWHFVALWYPGYSHDSDITRSDDLQKIVDGEYEEGDCAWDIIQDEWDGDEELAAKEARKEMEALNADIYEKAIQGFIDSIEKIERI